MSLKGLIALAVVYGLATIYTIPVAIALLIYVLFFSTRFIHQHHRIHQLHHLLEDYDHGNFDIHNGTVRIHYVESGDRSRPLLLLLHGFPEFWYSWHNQIKEFQNDYHVVAIDLRGYGDSSKPKEVSAYQMSNLVEDVRQVIAAVGKPKCYLAGHDWGGIIAYNFALKYPQQVQKLIVMNCPHPKATSKLSLFARLRQMSRLWYMFFFQCPVLPEKLLHANDMEYLIKMIKDHPAGVKEAESFTQEDEEAWKFVFGQPGAITPPIHYYRANIIPQESTGPAEQNVGSEEKTGDDIVQPPTMIIWGSADAVLSTDLAQASLQFCRQGTLRLLDGVSHWTQFDQPHRCNAAMREFLKA